MSTLFTGIRAILYASGFILLWGWVASGVQRLDPDLGLVLPATLRAPGIGLMVLGLPIALVCVASFVVRGRGTPAPFDAPRDFVPSGPYRYVRNPMYVGAWLALVGFGLFRQSGSIVLFSLVLLFAVHLFVLLVEEPGLEKRFGQNYLSYKRTTNRWLPRLPR